MKRKWKTKEEILSKFKELYTRYGKIPSRKELSKLHLSGLLFAIQEYGGMNTVYTELNIPRTTKPSNYWTDDTITQSLIDIIALIGTFPTQSMLKKLHHNDLLGAINKHGGLIFYRQKLGYKRLQVPKEYFKDINNVKNIINDFIKKYNYFPSISALEKFRPGIKFGILKYHGGYRNIRNILNQKQPYQEKGYWDNIQNVIVEINRIHAIIGHFPSYVEICKYSSSGFFAAIAKKHGGINNLRIKMGLVPIYKSHLERRVKGILNQYVADTDYVDNKRALLKKKFNLSLINPYTHNPLELDRYYFNKKIAIEIQGIQHYSICEFFSQNKNITPEEYLTLIRDIDNSKMEQCIQQGVLLIRIHYKATKEEILQKISTVLPLRKKPLSLTSTDMISWVDQCKQAFIKLKLESKVVTATMMKDMYPVLYKQMIEQFGNFYNARKYFKQNQCRLPRNSWTMDKVIDELTNLIKHNNNLFPTKKIIFNYNQKLYYGIVKHGGLRYFKKLLY